MSPRVSAGIAAISGLVLSFTDPAEGLPPPEDTPEEILRTQVIAEGRSPIDGRLLTAAEYAELQARLRSTEAVQPNISAELQGKIILLRVRKVLRTILPVIP